MNRTQPNYKIFESSSLDGSCQLFIIFINIYLFLNIELKFAKIYLNSTQIN